MRKYFVILCFVVLMLTGCVKSSNIVPERAQLSGELEPAFMAYRDGRLGDAERLLLEVLGKYPALSEVWFKLANVYYRTGRYNAAVRAYEKTVSYDAKNGRAWYNLALTRIQQADAALQAGEQQFAKNTEHYAMIRGLRTRLQSRSVE